MMSLVAGPGPNVIKLFVRNLRIFVKSLSVCPRQAFPAESNKHSSLARKFVNYGQKSFITLAPDYITGGYTSVGRKIFNRLSFGRKAFDRQSYKPVVSSTRVDEMSFGQIVF
jgi:hypothetical protein